MGMKAEERKDFDKEAAQWDANPGRVRLAGEVAGAIIREVGPTREMDVLDFGCGTGLVTTGVMASLAGLLGTVGMKRSPTDYMARLPTVVLLTIGAILVSQPLGLKLQEHFTTLGDPGDLQILSVRRESMTSITGRSITLHRVDTTSS